MAQEWQVASETPAPANNWEVESEAPAAKPAASQWEVASEKPAESPGFFTQAMDYLSSKVRPAEYHSVLEGKDLGKPMDVNPQKNMEAMLKSGSPDSVMYDPGRAEAMVQQGRKLLEQKEAYDKQQKQKARDVLQAKAHAEDYGILPAAKDIALGTGQGIANVGSGVLGLGEMATGWVPENPLHLGEWQQMGNKLQELGVSPQQIGNYISDLHTNTYKNQIQNIEDVEGFANKVKALGANPLYALDMVLQSAPSVLSGGAVAGSFRNTMINRLGSEAAELGLTGNLADQYVLRKLPQIEAKVQNIAYAVEGAQSAGQIADIARESGRDWSDYFAPSLMAGTLTSLIGKTSGTVANKLGIGDAELGIAQMFGKENRRFMTVPSLFKIPAEVLSEITQEVPQSVQEQINQNFALGKPWDDGLSDSALQAIVGAASLSGFHIAGSRAARAYDQAVNKIQPADQTKPTIISPLVSGQAQTEAPNEALPERNVSSINEEPINFTPEQEEAVQKETQRLVNTRGFSEDIARGMAENRMRATLGEDNVAGPNAEPTGAGVPVPTGTATTTPAGGVGGPERNGVVPNQQDAAAPIAGEGVKQSPVVDPETGEIIEPTPEKAETPKAEPTVEPFKPTAFIEPEKKVETVPTVKAPTPYEDGKATALAGFTSDINPHPAGTEEHKEWNQGHEAAGEVKLEPVNWEVESEEPAPQEAAKEEPVVEEPTKEEPAAETRDLSKPVDTVEGPVEIKDLQDANEHSENLTPEFHADVADAAAKVDKVEAAAEETPTTKAERKRKPGAGRPKKELKTPEEIANNKKMLADRAKFNAAVERARRSNKKAIAMLEYALAPLTEEEMSSPEEQAAAESDKESNFHTAIRLLNDNATGEVKLANVGKAAKEALNTYGITPEDTKKAYTKVEASKKSLEALHKAYGTNKPSAMSAPIVGKGIKEFSSNKTATQAISTIMKHGNSIERYFANHFRNFVKDVKFVVIEQGDILPPQLALHEKTWDQSRGLYIPEQGNRTIYVRGDSFGIDRGNDITTVLHEILHAAGSERIYVGVHNIEKNTKLTKAVSDIALVRYRARAVYEQLRKDGTIDKYQGLQELIDDVPVILYDDELQGATDKDKLVHALDEFLAYSLTQPEMKALLMATPSGPKSFLENLYNKFVNGLMDALNIAGDKAKQSAFTDLASAANDIMQARYSTREQATSKEYRSLPMQAERRPARINLARATASLAGYNTPSEQIKYFEDKKKALDEDLAKAPAGTYNPDWAERTGSGNMPKGQARLKWRELAAANVAGLKQHYDSVIENIKQEATEGKAPRASAKRSAANQEAVNNQEATTKGLIAVQASEKGYALGERVSALDALRSPDKLWNEMNIVFNAGNASVNQFLSHFYDADALGRAGPQLEIPALKRIYRSMQNMNGTTQNILKRAGDEIEAVQNFFRENPSKKELFGRLVNASTYDGYDPSNVGDRAPIKKYDDMWKALGTAGQAQYIRLRDYYKDMNEYKQELLRQHLLKLKDDMKPEDWKHLYAGFREAYEGSDKIDPYFPLMRFGDYVLNIGKKGDPNRTSLRFESSMERDRAIKNYSKLQGRSEEDLLRSGAMSVMNDTDSSRMRGTIENSSRLLKTAYDAIEKSTSMNKQEAKDIIYQAYLQTMPEQSIRKLFMHREGVFGFSNDITRVLASHAVKSSTALARLEFGGEMRNGLTAAREQLIGHPEYTPFVDRMSEFVKEMLAPTPTSELAKFADSAVTNLLVRPSFLHSLTSWSSALIQPADIFLKGLPILSGNHNSVDATAEITKAMAMYAQLGFVETLPDGTERWHAPTIELAKGLTSDERQAVKAMNDAGVTRNTMAAQVYGFVNNRNDTVDSKVWKTTKNIAGNVLFGGMMHHTERLSREVIFLAAYRLSMKDLAKSKMPYEERKQAAIDNAISETFETFGNYSTYSRPMVFRGPLGKATLLYKFFPYVTGKILIGNGLKMLSLKTSAKEKRVAATKFFGVMGTHLLLGGYGALPAFSFLMGAIGSAFTKFSRDPDAPEDMKDKDFNLWFRTVYMPSVLGHTGLGDLTALAERGPINYFTGVDLSSRISLNDMWYREPAPANTDHETLFNWAMTIGGAGPNAALGYYRGAKAIANGDYEKGMEQLAPGSLSGLMAAGRIATQGITTSQGDAIQNYGKGQVSPAIIAGQALGFKPDVLTNQQNKSFEATTVDKIVSLEKAALSQQIGKAIIKANDFEHSSDEERQRADERLNDLVAKAIEFSTKNPTQAYSDEEFDQIGNSASEKAANRTENAGIVLTNKNALVLEPVAERLKEERKK